ncbi:tripartite motif-containing protein 2-like [Anneissia japonica]|uniref:tripartite motif-containing protein 2-like n=1 Tax=Anneissia japonica TaxID=1529436 RepID=UPI001425B594|nr:tripartite motif-containing protein 2-like [Anneissia japonica]XP_033113727.1 tripartite motif-containing protein 2-like [Anneissia japonica]
MLNNRKVKSAGDNEQDTLKMALCPFHNDMRQVMYCMSCDKPVCDECIKLSHQNATHKKDSIKNVTQAYKRSLTDLTQRTTNMLSKIDKGMEDTSEVLELLHEEYDKCQADVENTLQGAVAILIEKKKQLRKDLNEKFTTKRAVLEAQRDMLLSIRHEITMINKTCQHPRVYPDHVSAIEWLKDSTQKMRDIVNNPPNYLPEENRRLVFKADEDFIDMLEETALGTINTNSAVGFNSTINTGEIQDVHTGDSIRLYLTTKDSVGSDVRVGGADVSGELKHPNHPKQYAKIHDNQDGTYVIEITPSYAGDCVYTIKLFEQLIKEGKLEIKCQPSLGDALDFTHSAFRDKPPFNVSVSTDGDIFVTNRTPIVYIFNRNGRFMRHIQVQQAGDLQGIVVTTDRVMFLTDHVKKQVIKCSSDGKLLRRFGKNELVDPVGVAVDKDGFIYIVDHGVHCILKFDRNGKKIQSFGPEIALPHRLLSPWFIDMCGDELIVSDTWNHRIQRFTKHGTQTTMFGVRGHKDGQFERPKGITCDADGNMLVSSEHHVQMFDKSGKFVKVVDNGKPTVDPRGLCVIPGEWRRVVVAEWGNSRVRIFAY